MEAQPPVAALKHMLELRMPAALAESLLGGVEQDREKTSEFC
jgi:hypothetical protein